MKNVASFFRTLWQWRMVATFLVLFLLVLGMFAAIYYASNISQWMQDRQQTVLFGPNRFSPETPASLRVVVRDQSNGQAMANADVSVKLQGKGDLIAQTLFTGKTDARGTVPVSFNIPANAKRDSTLIVETSSGAGRDHIERAVIVQRNYKILVTTDKPIYQPGQTIHLRALALGALDLKPGKDEKVEFLVQDPKGNKVFRRTETASAYGVVSTDFILADTVNAGDYKITASIGDTKSEKTVNVKPYVLPKFKVAVDTDKSYYLPSEKISGHVRVDYFFGKPVAKSDVTIKGIAYDVARAETISLVGKTDNEGVYSFSFTLPNYFAASGLNKNTADFGLEVSVTDQANHTEQTSLSLPISSDAIIIDAVPESGKLVPNVENIVYVLTSLPDGSPVECDVTVSGSTTPVKSGKYGLAEVRITPRSGNTTLAISARDAKGRSAAKSIVLQSETTSTQILLRPERATYRVGETMHLDAFTSGAIGTVYIDLIKEGQTISTRAVDSVSGKATADIDMTAEMIGTLQIHAYHVELNGTIVRDTRVVVVEQPSDLSVGVKADRDVYRPGDTSKVTFNVTNKEGKGVQSALGVSAVDESVFALAEQDPGFAKLYFLLQKELLEPRYQVKGFTLPEVVTYNPASDPATAQGQQLAAAQNLSAKAAWANATPINFSLTANSQPEKRDAATKVQVGAFNNLTAWLAILLALIPLAITGFVIASHAQSKILGKSLGWWMVGISGYCVTSPFVVGFIALLSRVFVEMKLGVVVTATGMITWLVLFGIVAWYAFVRRNYWIQVTLMLVVTYLVLFGMLIAVGQVATQFDPWLVLLVVLAYLIVLAALVLMGVGLLVQKERVYGIAAIALAALFIPITILVALMPSMGPMLRAMGNPGLYIPPAYLTGCSAAPVPNSSGNILRDLQQGTGTTMMSGAAPAPTVVAKEAAPGSAPAGTTEAPRLRQYFPETMFYNPQIITDDKGSATIDIPLADSITTWRLSVTASSQRGELGTTTAGIRVFQDFFVDLDLPVALTQNDEISVPVAVYNYLPSSQKVTLQIEKQPWFELQDQAEKTLTIASNDIDVVYFRIKALQFGMNKVKVTALGEKMSDAIQREIRVYPDGKAYDVTQSNWLKETTTQLVEIPQYAIAGASRIEVKIFPGVMSQAMQGLDGMLKVPYG